MTIEFPPGRPQWMPMRGRVTRRNASKSLAFNRYLHNRNINHDDTMQELADKHGMSQTNVWRRIQQVREDMRGNQ